MIANSAQDGDWRGFLRSRVLRLLPGTFACASISAVVALALGRWGPVETFELWVKSVLIWPMGSWIEAVYWTLAVELGFYLLVLGWIIHGRSVSLFRLALAICAVSAVYLLALAFDAAPLDKTSSRFLLLRHGCFFAAGIFLWCHLRGRQLRHFLWFLGALVISVGQIVMYADSDAPGLNRFPAVAVTIFLLGMVGILFSVSWRGSSNTLRQLGLVTYPLYLVHMPIGAAVIWTLELWNFPWWITSTAAMLAALLAAWTVHVCLERPLRNVLRTVWDASSFTSPRTTTF